MPTLDGWMYAENNRDILCDFISASIGLPGSDLYGITTIAGQKWLAFRSHQNFNGKIAWAYNTPIPLVKWDIDAINYFSKILNIKVDPGYISANTKYWKQYDGPHFLTEEQQKTYTDVRMPVRRIESALDGVCSICGMPGTPENPLQHAHRIGFHHGIKEFGLHPDFIDHDNHIVTAHRNICNQKAELTDDQIRLYVKHHLGLLI